MLCVNDPMGFGKVCKHGEQYDKTLCQNSQYGCCNDGKTERKSDKQGNNNYGCPTPQKNQPASINQIKCKSSKLCRMCYEEM